MEKKFELTDEKINFLKKTLYRIRALKSFSDVKTGDLGGFVEKESNLSQEGDCWVYHGAKAYDNAIIIGNAKISGNAKVADDAMICGNAKVYGNAALYNKIRVSDNAEVYDYAIVCDYAVVSGNARIYDRAAVFQGARVSDNAIVCGHAKVCGKARICGNAVIKEEQRIEVGCCTVDLSENLKENIRCQTNLFPQEDYVIAYKQVKKNLTSFYDNKFQYKIGEWVEAKNPDFSTIESCAGGLHFSNVDYWDPFIDSATYLMAKIMLDDIIAVQDGKIRCKRAFIIDRYDIEE